MSMSPCVMRPSTNLVLTEWDHVHVSLCHEAIYKPGTDWVGSCPCLLVSWGHLQTWYWLSGIMSMSPCVMRPSTNLLLTEWDHVHVSLCHEAIYKPATDWVGSCPCLLVSWGHLQTWYWLSGIMSMSPCVMRPSTNLLLTEWDHVHVSLCHEAIYKHGTDWVESCPCLLVSWGHLQTWYWLSGIMSMSPCVMRPSTNMVLTEWDHVHVSLCHEAIYKPATDWVGSCPCLLVSWGHLQTWYWLSGIMSMSPCVMRPSTNMVLTEWDHVHVSLCHEAIYKHGTDWVGSCPCLLVSWGHLQTWYWLSGIMSMSPCVMRPSTNLLLTEWDHVHVSLCHEAIYKHGTDWVGSCPCLLVSWGHLQTWYWLSGIMSMSPCVMRPSTNLVLTEWDHVHVSLCHEAIYKHGTDWVGSCPCLLVSWGHLQTWYWLSGIMSMSPCVMRPSTNLLLTEWDHVHVSLCHEAIYKHGTDWVGSCPCLLVSWGHLQTWYWLSGIMSMSPCVMRPSTNLVLTEWDHVHVSLCHEAICKPGTDWVGSCPCLLVSWGHLQTWYWLSGIMSMSSIRKDFNYFHHLMVKNLQKLPSYFSVSPTIGPVDVYCPGCIGYFSSLNSCQWAMLY